MENAGNSPRIVTARGAGLVGCPSCGRVHRRPVPSDCLRCGRSLPDLSVPDQSLQRVWAWLFAGIVAYIPANLYPMLQTTSFGRTTESNIVEGVIDLLHHGSFTVAAIVFIASIAIPVAKFAAIAYLALSVQRGAKRRTHGRHRLHTLVEFIGRWSMVDVFVVAILAALVQLDFAATITPGIAAISFSLSVAFTMLSAQSFNPKSIWPETDAAHP